MLDRRSNFFADASTLEELIDAYNTASELPSASHNPEARARIDAAFRERQADLRHLAVRASLIGSDDLVAA